jgi:hypothetical protein
MTGALTGLLGVAGIGCGEDSPKGEPDPIRSDAAPVCMCPTPSQPDAGMSVADAAKDSPPAMTMADAGGDAAPSGPTVTSEKEANRTFADVTKECDARAGYTQVHAACAGANSCAGFSYGDWEPGITSEHTCAGTNGCNGISCVVLAKDGGKSGKDIYEAKLPETGPRSCTNCHGGYDEATKKTDVTKFKVYFMPGEQESPGGRTMQNWLQKRSAAEQARMVAFGSIGRLPDGMAFSHMSAYHKVFSRAEIERVVDYLRTQLQPIEAKIKIKD